MLSLREDALKRMKGTLNQPVTTWSQGTLFALPLVAGVLWFLSGCGPVAALSATPLIAAAIIIVCWCACRAVGNQSKPAKTPSRGSASSCTGSIDGVYRPTFRRSSENSSDTSGSTPSAVGFATVSGPSRPTCKLTGSIHPSDVSQDSLRALVSSLEKAAEARLDRKVHVALSVFEGCVMIRFSAWSHSDSAAAHSAAGGHAWEDVSADLGPLCTAEVLAALSDNADVRQGAVQVSTNSDAPVAWVVESDRAAIPLPLSTARGSLWASGGDPMNHVRISLTIRRSAVGSRGGNRGVGQIDLETLSAGFKPVAWEAHRSAPCVLGAPEWSLGDDGVVRLAFDVRVEADANGGASASTLRALVVGIDSSGAPEAGQSHPFLAEVLLLPPLVLAELATLGDADSEAGLLSDLAVCASLQASLVFLPTPSTRESLNFGAARIRAFATKKRLTTLASLARGLEDAATPPLSSSIASGFRGLGQAFCAIQDSARALRDAFSGASAAAAGALSFPLVCMEQQYRRDSLLRARTGLLFTTCLRLIITMPLDKGPFVALTAHSIISYTLVIAVSLGPAALLYWSSPRSAAVGVRGSRNDALHQALAVVTPASFSVLAYVTLMHHHCTTNLYHLSQGLPSAKIFYTKALVIDCLMSAAQSASIGPGLSLLATLIDGLAAEFTFCSFESCRNIRSLDSLFAVTWPYHGGHWLAGAALRCMIVLPVWWALEWRARSAFRSAYLLHEAVLLHQRSKVKGEDAADPQGSSDSSDELFGTEAGWGGSGASGGGQWEAPGHLLGGLGSARAPRARVRGFGSAAGESYH